MITTKNRDVLRARVAEMYYQRDMTQTDIARRLCLSRTLVSRLVQEAKKEKLVDIQICGEIQRNFLLENLLKKQFSLKEAVISANSTEDEEESYASTVRAAAQYLDTVLSGNVVCVASGRETVLPVLEALHGKLINTLITDERTALNILIREGKKI